MAVDGLFLAAVFFSLLVSTIPIFATSHALILVGAVAQEIESQEFRESFPAAAAESVAKTVRPLGNLLELILS